MTPEGWVAVIGSEYLASFVREGGAAVKFAAASTDAGRAELRQRLLIAAEAHGFLVATVDAAEVRLHLIDRLFHDVARQVDWDGLARAFLERLLRARGLRLPHATEPLSVARLAELNAAPGELLRTELRQALAHELFEDYAMSREFRLAMFSLCVAQLDPTDNPALAASIKEWLRGELRLVSEVKRALIFQKIARHNARHMLFSLAHWLTLMGTSGLLLVLDVARCAEALRPAERGPGNYYTTSATMDLYELLRQLIDATDEVQACFVAVLVGPDFLHDDRRGIRSYQALYFRIWDEVYDRNRENPFSSLVRIAGAA
ncbi:MAG: ATP-binding protein [Chloroflexota bacterium]|nr:ATP-binding protein [Chloroflexota bacterium]